MDLKQKIGLALQQKIDAGLNANQIGRWAWRASPENCLLLDSETRDILIDLYTILNCVTFQF